MDKKIDFSAVADRVRGMFDDVHPKVLERWRAVSIDKEMARSGLDPKKVMEELRSMAANEPVPTYWLGEDDIKPPAPSK